MNKTLLSAVFLTGSGLYVAYANHALDGIAALTGRSSERTEIALTALAKPATQPSIGESSGPSSMQPQVKLVAPAVAPALPSAAPAKPAPTIVATAPVPQPAPIWHRQPAPVASVQQTQSVAQATTSSGLRDGSYTGTDENAYYGRVQVQVSVASGQITAVKVLDYPSDRRTSRSINSQALPMLQQEVMQAQSAQIDTVSGATLTSEAYIRSLGNALQKAGSSNA